MKLRIHQTPPSLPPGSYPGKIVDLEPVEGRDGKPDQLKWTVAIPHKAETYEARTWTNDTFHTYSPEYRWASTILGMAIDSETDLDTNDLIGAPVIAKVSVGKGRQGQPQYYIDDMAVPKASRDQGEAKADPEDDVAFNYGDNEK